MAITELEVRGARISLRAKTWRKVFYLLDLLFALCKFVR